MKFFTAILSAFALASATPIAPLHRVGPVIFTLNVTHPTANETWFTGSRHLVEWATFGVPTGALNHTGTLFLGYRDGISGPVVQLPEPLAQGFSLENGEQMVTVPKVQYRFTYVVILEGFISKGISLEFTIIPY